MNKKTSIHFGFLLLKEWLPVLEPMSAKDFKALVLGMMYKQFENRPMPTFHNVATNNIARLIEPTIDRRLKGAAWAKKGAEAHGTPIRVPTPPPIHLSEAERSEAQRSEIKRITSDLPSELRGAEQREAPSPAAADASGAHRAPSKKKGKAETDENIPTAYLEQRQLRAIEYARKNGQDVLAVLSAWWKQDKAAFLAAQREEADTDDTSAYWEDFFEAAVARSGTSQA